MTRQQTIRDFIRFIDDRIDNIRGKAWRDFLKNIKSFLEEEVERDGD